MPNTKPQMEYLQVYFLGPHLLSKQLKAISPVLTGPEVRIMMAIKHLGVTSIRGLYNFMRQHNNTMDYSDLCKYAKCLDGKGYISKNPLKYGKFGYRVSLSTLGQATLTWLDIKMTASLKGLMKD